MYGRWPGLAAGTQVDGDLAVTTDYRQVLGDVVKARFPDASLATVFPGVFLRRAHWRDGMNRHYGSH